ncbi:futalosine hydrolase [Deinococcus maricopensis]|nr:futalosine hydrolase [Deinococcus maricopensis]
MDVLVVVATEGEAALLRDLGVRVVVSGVGAVAAALATAGALASGRAALVVSAGIGGAFEGCGAALGGVAVSSRMVYGQLGAEDGEAFLPLGALGLEVAPGNVGVFPAWSGAAAFAGRLGAPLGAFVTVETATGSARSAAALRARYADAVMEGMEGAGVAHAAFLAGVPAVEVRGVSNWVGPRDRASWQIGAALRAVRGALAVLVS